MHGSSFPLKQNSTSSVEKALSASIKYRELSVTSPDPLTSALAFAVFSPNCEAMALILTCFSSSSTLIVMLPALSRGE
jgi:hypothetical protein